MDKPTLILGASSNPARYSHMATLRLKKHGHTVFPVGIKEGKIEETLILTGKPALSGVHTVTLYIGPRHQPEWADYILGLHPKRIIFNPGAENAELFAAAAEKGIECVEACTLVMLSTGQY
jgi:predicted CoA-binding protein